MGCLSGVATVRCQLALTHLLTTCKEQMSRGAPVRSQHTTTAAREREREKSRNRHHTHRERASEREAAYQVGDISMYKQLADFQA